MNTLRYEVSQQIPVLRDVDVLVIGGGPGGIGAAVAAARQNQNTLLVERYGFLGGMSTVGEVHPFMRNQVGDQPLDGPVYMDWVRAMAKYVPEARKTVLEKKCLERGISKDAAMLGAEDLVLDSGVSLLYHHELVDVVREDAKIIAAVFHSKSGFVAIRAKYFIDCTGDADLAALSGCEIEQGGPEGHSQPMTTCFKLGNVDTARLPDRENINQLYLQARKRGEVNCPRNDVLFFNWFESDVIHFNTTRICKRKATDGVDLSEAEIEGRKQIRQFLTFLRNQISGFENARIHSIAHHVGVRESRRVRGIDYLERDAFEKRAKFPDAIARVRYQIDIHAPDGGGTELVRMAPGEWYEIPYGCIVPKNVDNLLIGGRPISVDHAIHSSMRVMPPACTIGQAAGIAAAMAQEANTMPSKLSGIEVRERLREFGAEL